MRLGDHDALYLLILVVLTVVFYIYAFKKRRQAIVRFTGPAFAGVLTDAVSRAGQRLKAVLMTAAVLFLVLALIRPQWGFHWEEIKRSGLDILIAVDTSKSMLAGDVKPNRLERARMAVKDLVGKLKGDRVGLIAYSGSAFLMSPLTVDYGGFMLSLNDLSAGSIPKGGTSLASAVTEAMQAFKGEPGKHKVLILITDGEDNEGGALDAATDAAKEGIRIYTVGIGTKEGELIRVPDGKGRVDFLKDRQGNVVKSRLDEETLKQMAHTTGGVYVAATGTHLGLDRIYDEYLSTMEKRDFDTKREKHFEERFQIPLAIALVLLILESLIGERKRQRRKR